MANRKQIAVFIVLGCCLQAYARPQSGEVSSTVSSVSSSSVPPTATPEKNSAQTNAIAEGLGLKLQNTMMGVLLQMANSTGTLSTNISRSAAIVARGLVGNILSFSAVVTHVPRLLFLDGPTQFVEMLRLIRSGQVQIPQDMDSAIDTLIAFGNQMRNSGAGENFMPLFTAWPNIFQNVGELVNNLVDGVFSFVAPI